MPLLSPLGNLQQFEFREPLEEVAAVDGGQTIGLGVSVGGDEEIRDEVELRAAGLAVALEVSRA